MKYKAVIFDLFGTLIENYPASKSRIVLKNIASVLEVPAEDFIKFWTEHEMPFVGVPDNEHRIAEPYGQQVKLLKAGRLPALFVIDKNGLIRAKHFGSSMSDIPTDDDLFTILEKLNREQQS